MYAIIADGSHQYRVEKDDLLWVLNKEGKNGTEKKVEFPVLLIADGKKVDVGTPHVKGAKVVGEIVEHARGEKVRVFKYQRRKDNHRTIGARQDYTAVKITDIVKGK